MIKAIEQHRSIRKYKSDPIPQAVLHEILVAGSRASTTGNMQVYSMIVTTEPEIKSQLWEAHFKQPMTKQAPVVVTFCADFNRFNKWCTLRGAKPGYDNFLSFTTAAIDALLASQNVALEAQEHGLGICYLGTTTYMAQKIIDILNLPTGVVPVTTVVLGYPDETPELTDRLPLDAVVHYQKYSDYSDEKINELYAQKESMPFYRDIVKENEVETLAHVFTDKRYTKQVNVDFSNALLKVLENQGFMNQ